MTEKQKAQHWRDKQREYQKKYRNKPDFKEKNRLYQRKYRARMRALLG